MIRFNEAKEFTHVSVVSAARPLSRNRGRHLVLVGLRQKGALASGERNLEASAIKALLDAAGLAVFIAIGREPAEVAGEIKRRGAVGEEVERNVRSGAVAGAKVADDGAAYHLWLGGVALFEIRDNVAKLSLFSKNSGWDSNSMGDDLDSKPVCKASCPPETGEASVPTARRLRR